MAMVFFLLTGCASLAGLQELDHLPSDFPLVIEGPTGHITEDGSHNHIAVDRVFSRQEDALKAWSSMRDEAVAKGYKQTEKGRHGKVDRFVLKGSTDRLEISCCRQRADRQWLVLLSWFKEG